MAYNPLDVVWILLCTVLVIIMQPGFVFFETGLTRAKNSISVSIKNLADFCLVGIIFGLFGYGLMFGTSINGLIGSSLFLFDAGSNPLDQASMLFQLSFCATSVTIISGAVAERIRFVGYLITALITASCIYPITGHWIWGIKDSSQLGWLANSGFIDYAGATVVHAVGGSAALAAIIIIGPRQGRFDEDHDNSITGENYTYAAAGVFLLIMGWLGFNGGSTLATSSLLPLIFLNTLVAGVFGGLATMVLTWNKERGPNIVHIMVGILAGLVSITGTCNMVSTLSAAAIGAVGGGISLYGIHIMEKFKIDDAVGAVPVHLFPGIWGTLAVAIFSRSDSFMQGYSRLDQLFVQLTGSISAVGYSFCTMFILLTVIQKYVSLRVSPDIERIGLNAGEHGVKSEMYLFAERMHTQYTANNFSTREDINPHSDIGALQVEYNHVLDAVHTEAEQHKTIENELLLRARTDGLTQLANRHYFDEILNKEWHRAMREEKSLSLIFADIDHFKEYNDYHGHQAGDLCLINISKAISSFAHRSSDLVARYGGEEFTILLPNTNLNHAVAFAERIRAAIFALKIKRASSDIDSFVTISAGVASILPHQGNSCHRLVEMADKALYRAKRSGRNRVEAFEEPTN